MEQEPEYLKEKIAEYRAQLAPLIRYLPWLKEAAGSSGSTIYRGDGSTDSSMLTFPVYDATLMSFIKEASNTPLMDRNYPYVYSRRRLQTPEDERRLIESCDYKDWDLLKGILSRYVLGGRTKSVLWSQGLSEQIFYLVVNKMNDIVLFWDSEKNI